MKKIIFLIYLLTSTFVIGQSKEIKLAAKVTYGLYADMFINSPSINLGINYGNNSNNTYVYFAYNFMRNSLYKGHYLGITFEHHFLSDKKRFRPFLGLSILSEITSNYKEGFIEGTDFLTRNGHIKYTKFIGGNSSYYIFNSSGFYYSTPLFATLSLGFDVRLIKDLHLSFSLGYGLQVMRYKYLEWINDEDYRELLKEEPMKKKVFHYVNAQLGLSYAFPLKKTSKTQ